MAEAHAAVAFSFSVTQDGLNVQISQDAIRAVYYSGVRSWRKRAVRFLNRFSSGVYPATFSSLGVLILAIMIGHMFNYDLTYGINPKIHGRLFTVDSYISWCFSGIISCAIIWVVVVLIIRYLLKLLLCYNGWMFEGRGKMSIATKLWAVMAKILGGRNPKLYSYQASLPRLPVPALKDTVARYLRSARPLLDDEEYNSMCQLSESFLSTIGSKLQRYLILKSWWASNYVSDWWEQYVYLSGRGPLMVNSNYYGMDLLFYTPTNVQASRAANVCHALFAFRSKLDKEEIKPLKVNGVVPLCSAQFERLFNTSRVPGLDTDVIHHWSDCRHIAVYHKGRWFKLFCYKNGVLLEPSELELAFEAILDDESLPYEGEEHLAALTAAERIPWAKARSLYFSDGINRRSLHAIEKAAFVMVLDEDEFSVNENDMSGLTDYGRSLLHGTCFNRWFDKSFNCIVYKNGRFGMNAEHSWADAPIIGYLAEAILGYEIMGYEKNGELKLMGYRGNGKVLGEPMTRPLAPQRLAWDLPKHCKEMVETSLEVAKNLADDVHLHVMPFKHFGKGLVKTFKISPDAFIQAALQVAHLRDKGKFALTYEASMTRLYREGRTETVRSCTSEMTSFARSMENPDCSAKERHALLKKAAERHVVAYKEAMSGQGIDRHLFCLYVVSKYLKLESPFLQKVLGEQWKLSTSQTSMEQGRVMDRVKDSKYSLESAGGGFGPVLTEPWRLSTSQTPHQQLMRVDLHKHPSFVSGGGGFGPVADDGYGVSYIICHENLIMFHVSSKYSSLETDSERFTKNIEKAMLDIRDLCEEMKK